MSLHGKKHLEKRATVINEPAYIMWNPKVEGQLVWFPLKEAPRKGSRLTLKSKECKQNCTWDRSFFSYPTYYIYTDYLILRGEIGEYKNRYWMTNCAWYLRNDSLVWECLEAENRLGESVRRHFCLIARFSSRSCDLIFLIKPGNRSFLPKAKTSRGADDIILVVSCLWRGENNYNVRKVILISYNVDLESCRK